MCDASSDVCLGDDIWRTGCCPCSTSPLSTSLIDPKEQRNCYGLTPVPSQELPERGCGQQRTALGAPTPDFSSRFTPEAFSVTGCQAARQRRFKMRVFLLLDRHPFWANELYLPKDPENIQLAPKPQDTPSPSSGDLCICTADDIVEVLPFQGSGAFILSIRSNTISFANWMPRRNQGQEKSERAREVEVAQHLTPAKPHQS